MLDAYLLLIILILTLAMFIWGYFRYDTVALINLVLLVLLGIIPSDQAFSGFSNPAVITVACVMVITAVISETGLIELSLNFLTPFFKTPVIHISIMCLIGAFLSAFMNNIGALALLMPLAIQSANDAKMSPSKILMPLSFATVLGGMTTKFGTPPNLLISSFKEQATGTSFEIFDFLPVGLSVAAVCLAFICIFGWRLLPERRKPGKGTEEIYKIQDYITEVQIPDKSPLIDMKKKDFEQFIEGDFSLLGLIRKRKKRLVIPSDEPLQQGDILIVQANHEDLGRLISKGNLELVHGVIVSQDVLRSEEIGLMEAVVVPGSRLEGRSWSRLRITANLQLNLVAIARSGRNIKNRLNHVNLNVGDVVLVQGDHAGLQENIVSLGLVPLATRSLNVGFKRKKLMPIILFLSGIILASTQMINVSISFLTVVVLLVVLNLVPMRRVYQSIDWSIIILLAALIPLGTALKSTGAADMISQALISIAGTSSPVLAISILLIITMTLSDIMNNAATAVVMAPIAINLANNLQLNVDAFLMAVAIGASCSFLTPISHQNNTLVMEPGRYHFFDFTILGVPVEIFVILTAIPTLSYFWL